MLLLAPELLSIAVCSGTADIELGPVNTINELAYHKLCGAVCASGAA